MKVTVYMTSQEVAQTLLAHAVDRTAVMAAETLQCDEPMPQGDVQRNLNTGEALIALNWQECEKCRST